MSDGHTYQRLADIWPADLLVVGILGCCKWPTAREGGFMTPEEIERVLTKAQRRIIMELPTDGSFVNAYDYCRQRRTRMALTNGGITEPYNNGPVTLFAQFRLSPFGLSVRAILEAQNDRPDI